MRALIRHLLRAARPIGLGSARTLLTGQSGRLLSGGKEVDAGGSNALDTERGQPGAAISLDAQGRLRPRQQKPSGAVALVVLAACVAHATEGSAIGDAGRGARLWRSPAAGWSLPPWDVAGGYPGLPPSIAPAILQQFALLLSTYHALTDDSTLTFHQWIVLNSVTDPRQQMCLLWLYSQYTSRVAAA